MTAPNLSILYSEMVIRIISEQEKLIGPIALEQAGHVKGLKVNWPKRDISFEDSEIEVIGHLVEKYKVFFGQVSVEVCKHAVKQVISKLPPDERPQFIW